MKKIVFIACSPDMWEGFETKYFDHLNDPECTVTVIPAIILTKTADGLGINPVCQTEGYPDYLNITHFKDYDIETENPDIIYIQNAQDNDNLGISLHPDFYTSNLKKFTKELVYIPYNVFEEEGLEDQFDLDAMRHLLVPPRINNIDRVIVQSQYIKDAMLRLIAGKDSVLYESWNNRISWEDYPRVRLLQMLSAEDFTLPEEWNAQIYDENGNKKKTILFCLSVIPMLTQDKIAINYAKHFLEKFKNDNARENTCLIFRPHPQMLGILKRLRPYIADDYENLLDFYKKNDLGILDDNISPAPSIILSDSYIGYSCGTSALYKTTGKPMEIIPLFEK